MPVVVRSIVRRAGAAACLLLVCAARVGAQASGAPAATGPDILSHYTFHLGASKLAAIDDARFDWDAHFGGDVDLIDYVVGRFNFLADYEVVLGSELRPYDPNQGNYTLEGSTSLRLGPVELAGAFHHESRHLSDRPKIESVAWNAVLGRVLTRVVRPDWRVDGQASLGSVVKRDFVDYTWVADADVRMQRAVNPRVSAFARGVLQIYGVDPSLAARGTQTGGRVEAGVQLGGRGGAVDLFAGFEQRVDAYPLDRVPQRWMLAGFRLVGNSPR